MNNTIVLILGLALPVFFAFGIMEIILRFTGYRQLEKKIAGQKIVLEEKPTNYELIQRALKDLPPEIEIDKHVTLLKKQLSLMANTLKEKSLPFSSWVKVFQESASILGDFLPIEDKIQPLLANRTLKIMLHLNGFLTQQVNDIRSCAQVGDEKRCDRSISQLRDTIEEWTHLTKDWHDLRTVASAGIDTIDKFEKIKARWGWLRHGIEIIFQDPETNRRFVWFPWDVLSRPNLLVKLTAPIAKEAETMGEFDTICAMSSTSSLVATLMSTQLGKELLAIDDEVFLSLPRDTAKPGERILLVDSSIQTGRHLSKVMNKIQGERAVVVGAVCICINDLLPEDRTKLHIVDKMLDRGKIIYLYEISDLYKLWKERRWIEEEQE